MPSRDELRPLICGLCEPDPSGRERAGVAIFRLGCALAKSATQAWFFDSDLTTCIARDRTGIPELTVGLAVHPETFEKIHVACGSPRLAAVPPDQDAREFELDFPGGARIDILTVAKPGGTGAISRFLEKSGEAIQQVEIYVTAVDRVTGILRSRFGLSPVYPTTRAGADGTRVNFYLLPADQSRKVLIELVDNPQRNARQILK